MRFNDWGELSNLHKIVTGDAVASLSVDSDSVTTDADNRPVLEEMMSDRLAEFDYEYDLALVWHVAGRNSPVKIDPRLSFGAPTVNGVPTWVLKGRWNAGESLDDIVEDFGISSGDALSALHFEGLPA